MKRKAFVILQLIIGTVFIWQTWAPSMVNAQTKSNNKLLGVVIMVNGNNDL